MAEIWTPLSRSGTHTRPTQRVFAAWRWSPVLNPARLESRPNFRTPSIARLLRPHAPTSCSAAPSSCIPQLPCSCSHIVFSCASLMLGCFGSWSHVVRHIVQLPCSCIVWSHGTHRCCFKSLACRVPRLPSPLSAAAALQACSSIVRRDSGVGSRQCNLPFWHFVSFVCV